MGAEGGERLALSGARMAESIQRRRRAWDYQRVFFQDKNKYRERWEELKDFKSDVQCIQHVHDRFSRMHTTRKGGPSWLCVFGILLQIPTEVTSPDSAEATFKEGGWYHTFWSS